MSITINGLTKRYEALTAVDGLDLEIRDGEFLVLLGPSGCGKTTTMRSIVGLEHPDEGRVTVQDRVVFDRARGIDVPIHLRHMGMVFQSYAIWPHKSVKENVAFPLKMQGASRKEIDRRVQDVLELVGLSDFGDRGASKLSGGQMQRVALARSVVHEPAVLLLDEPLSNLDAKLRDRMRVELREFQQRLGITAVYVTHDQAEALALGDRVAVMNAGRIMQLGTPDEVYHRPTSHFVADFLGSANLAEVTVIRRGTSDVRVNVLGTALELAVDPANVIAAQDSASFLCIRPEDVLLQSAPEDANGLRGVVTEAVFQGQSTSYAIQVEGGAGFVVRGVQMRAPALSKGMSINFVLPKSALRVVSA